MKYQINENFKNEWKKWEDPVNTLEELQDALDYDEDYITIWVVKDIDENGIVTYEEQKFDSLPLETMIYLYGVHYEDTRRETGDAVALVKILS